MSRRDWGDVPQLAVSVLVAFLLFLPLFLAAAQCP